MTGLGRVAETRQPVHISDLHADPSYLDRDPLPRAAVELAGIRTLLTVPAKDRLPAMYQTRENVVAGGFLSYGSNLSDLFRHGASYVHRILQGAKPADLPVEQPTKFELAINLRTANTLGLTLSELILLRADEVIE